MITFRLSQLLGISQSAFAVLLVAGLFALFLLLLFGTFARSRRAVHDLAGAGRPLRAGPAAELGPRPRVVISRRDFFRSGLLASLGVFAAQFGGASLAFLWPKLSGFGSVITLPDPLSSIKDQIQTSRAPYYFGAGRFYLINYNGAGDKDGGPYAGITAEGLMALYQKCPHLGCRVPFCDQSQWFECPCHGSKYNHAGEWQLGPAPTGMHRFKLTVSGETVQVDTSKVILGPSRGTNTIHQAPEGPFCVA
jgi:cytochrome b6-f complex iron-sulfur subunit